MATVTLADLPAPVAALVIAGLIAVSWLVSFDLGGATSVAPQWFYLPIFVAGLRFGRFGALLAAGVSTLAAGPLLPADAVTGAPQALSEWVSRGVFFVLIGELVTALFEGARRLAAREAHLESEVELGTAGSQARETRFSALVQNSSDLVTIVDRDATISFQSPSVARVLGWDAESTVGSRLTAAVHESDRERWQTVVDFLLEGPRREIVVEWRLRHADGSWHFLQSVVTNLVDEPSVGGLVLNSRDVTDQKVLEDQLRHQAFHDSLTGLANRALFSEQLEQAVRRRGRIGAGLALLFIDLDSFKTVNDLHGHAVGDELLKKVAGRLQTTLRDADVIGRLGGDEFAVLFEGVALNSKPRSAAARLIEAFAHPFAVGSSQLFVTASIGMALDHAGESAEDLLRNADLAMYAAKAKNRGNYEVFSPRMHSMILDRMQLASDLRHALDQREFQVYYQPIVDDSSGTIDAVEALIRWNHPQRGLILPDEFISAAESSGMILRLGEWMLRQACQEFVATTRAVPDGERFGLSVNLSTRQLSDPTLFDTVLRALTDAGLDPNRVTLEITESAIMDDVGNAVRVLTRLRNNGVKIAIDDFGTGYSSLSLLSQIPLDTLKIDRAFITDITKRSEPAQLLRAILLLASDLGLHTVAEGVEEFDQHQLLHELGCKASQGFHFAKPQPAAQLLELLQQDVRARPLATMSGPTS